MGKGISVFFPIYNDWGTVGSMAISAVTTLEGITDDYEVILVNDGSEDKKIKKILDKIEQTFDKVRVIHHEKNRGYGGALRTGFANATKELIFYTDGDAQYDPTEMTLLFPLMKDNVDMVNGYKIKRSDPIHRAIVGRIYHWIVKFFFGLKVRDVDCDFRLVRKSVFDKVKLESNSGMICVELVKKIQDAGYNIVECPVHHYFRISGKSQFFNFPRVFKTCIELIKLWWQLEGSKKNY